MNRRRFVQQAGAAAAGCGVLGLGLGSRGVRSADCSQRPPAVQLYTIRDALQSDPSAALAALRDIGIREAELYGLNGTEDGRLFDMTARQFKQLLDNNDIRVPMSHVNGELTNVPAIAELAHALGIETLVVALPAQFSETRDGRFRMVGAKNLAQMDMLAERLDAVGRQYAEAGLAFGYHNHHVEFLSVEDTIPYEYLMARTDPDNVKIELDLGWLAVAGIDPVDYLQRYGDRVVACHLKDYDPSIQADVLQRKLVEPGAGTIDFAAALEAMNAIGVAHGFIEIDVSDDPLGAVARGHVHLQSLGIC
jgi:sugar phosphate isomerase/epimerase